MIRNKFFIIVCLGSLLGCQSTSIKTQPTPLEPVYVSPEEEYVPPPPSTSSIENRSEIKALAEIDPKYPIAAARQGIEGFCRVSFDIELNKPSRPHNIKILECSPSDIFEENCITSVSKWIFSPSNSQESPKGLITTCEFKL